MTLVREFAAGHSEAAFAELAERHVGLVHAAALRQTGDSDLAGEITQAVFIILARKAALLGPKTVLSAWLCQTTRYAAADALKSRRRRQAREQEAYMQSTLNEPTDAEAGTDAWTQLAPLLDDALAELGETDRAALVLRYFENKNGREIALALRIGEAAAQKRVVRALEKLRGRFVKRGVTLTGAVIAGAVAANAAPAAPTGMAVAVAAVAAKGGAISATITTLVKGTMKTMTWIKIKFAAAIGAGILLGGGAITLAFSHDETVGPADGSAVAAFKDFLSTPPPVAQLVYSELPSGNQTTAAVQGDSFYWRENAAGAQAWPIVGRYGNMPFQITFGDGIGIYGVYEVIHSEAGNPDPYSAMAANIRTILDGILNFGPQNITPGSLVWHGDEFEAADAQAGMVRRLRYIMVKNGRSITNDDPVSLSRLYGHVKIKNGLVVALDVGHHMQDGTPTVGSHYTYTYDAKAGLPPGIPARIHTPRKTYVIEKVVFAEANSTAAEAFNPTNFINPDLSMFTVISNGITVVKAAMSKKVQDMLNHRVRR